MRHLFLTSVGILCALAMTSCGTTKSNSSAAKASVDDVKAAAEAGTLDCTAFMQDVADDCFQAAVYEDDGVSLRNDIDENGNVLGPVDQAWAADFCTCFAQVSFDSFGCETVAADQSLEDDAWKTKYENIGKTCVDAVRDARNAQNAASNDAAPVDTDAAPADAAQDAAPADAPAAQ